MTRRRVRAWTVASVALLAADLVLAVGVGAAAPTRLDPDLDTTSAPAAVLPRPAAQAQAPAVPADSGEWGPVLDWGVQAKHMAALSTGKVLVWSTGANARVWDPTTGLFTLTPATFGDLHCAGQSTLADGRVIVVGGQKDVTHAGTNITALFDPLTETWTRGQDMTDLRWYASSTTLADGRVLATSGDAPDGSRSPVPEVYDPATDSWTRLTGAERPQSLYPLMFVLPNGLTYDSGPKSATAIYDTSGVGSQTPGPTAPYSTSGYSESAVMYRPGKILRAGGGDPSTTNANVIDMTAASPAWRAVAPMTYARRRMNLTILADGSVMAIGGTGSGDNPAAAVLAGEIWDPGSETWTTVEAMTEARMYHSSAVMLVDGRVVVGGGEADGRLRAQVYSPPYLFKGPRPTIAGAPPTAAYGSIFAFTSPEAASITSVALIRPSAATHAFDMNQRYVPLGFSRSGSTITASAPASGGVAPPGDYMLIVKSDVGVPSVAAWIRIGSAGSLEPGSVSGRVTSESTGLPIAGATVTSAQGTRTTDVDGTYAFETVPSGEFTATFDAPGFATESKTVQVTGGGAAVLDAALRAPGGVKGTVTHATTGLPLEGVTITYPGGSTLTDAAGAFAVSGLPSGPATLTFAATAFDGVERSVEVIAGADIDVNVAMTPTATYVVGEVRDATTTLLIPGAAIAISTGQTTTADAQGRYRVDLPPGTYTVTASASGYSPSSGPIVINGGSYATLDLALQPIPTPATLTFISAGDSMIRSTSATKNYGTLSEIRLRAGTSPSDVSFDSFLRFDVTGLAGRGVTGATLRLRVTDGGPHGGVVYRTATTWTETGVTWANAPTRIEPALATVGAVAVGQWVDIALPTSVVTGDGPVALRLVAGNANSILFSSRESADKPELRLQVGGGAPPTPSPTPTATPTASPTPTATPTATPAATPTPIPTATASPTPTPVGTPTATPTATPTPTPTATPAATPTPTPTPTGPPGGGTRIKDITFEGGLLDPTTGFDKLSGVVSLETAGAIGGIASARVPNAVGYLQEDFVATNDLHISFRVRVTGLSSSSPRFAMLSNAGTTTGNLVLTSTGRLRLRSGSTTIGVDSPPLQLGVTYRVGLHQRRGTGGDGVLEAYVAADGAPFGTPFARMANGTWTTAADRLRIGATNSSAVNLTFDDVLLGADAMPAVAQAASGIILVAAVAPSDRTAPIDFGLRAPSDLLLRGFLCPI